MTTFRMALLDGLEIEVEADTIEKDDGSRVVLTSSDGTITRYMDSQIVSCELQGDVEVVAGHDDGTVLHVFDADDRCVCTYRKHHLSN